MEIRMARKEDLAALNEIYNEVLLGSTAIYAEAPTTLVERESWWQARRAAGFPVLVAEGSGGAIEGFASLSEFRSWPGYRFTVEGTIHIHSGSRRGGVGSALLQALIASARAMGKHVLIAGVDSENLSSLKFLQRHGFVQAGLLREVGFKFGRFLDLVLLQLPLEDTASSSA